VAVVEARAPEALLLMVNQEEVEVVAEAVVVLLDLQVQAHNQVSQETAVHLDMVSQADLIPTHHRIPVQVAAEQVVLVLQAVMAI
jgi:hypothetical protein